MVNIGSCNGTDCPEMIRMKGKLQTINTLQKFILAFFIGTFAFQYATLSQLNTFIAAHARERITIATGTEETRRTAEAALKLITVHLDKNLSEKCDAKINLVKDRVARLEYEHSIKNQ